ncbi:MAG: mycothione reductase [Tetrasphaera sp.]
MSASGDEHYDILVLGAGSGRMVLDEAVVSGRHTAIVDPGPYGGTCLNRGCIPTKMFLHVAGAAHGVPDLARLGVDAHVDEVRWADIRDRVFGRIDPFAAAGPEGAQGAGIDAYAAPARFTGPRRVVIGSGDDRVVATADQVVIATGAHPLVPEVVSRSGVPFHTSDTVMRLDKLPRRMLILGGGVVGVEMATLFGGLGVEITLVSRGPSLIRGIGPDIGRRFTDLMGRRWALHLGCELTALHQEEDGIHARCGDGTVLLADVVLVATGRWPTTADLGLESAGVDVDPGTGRVLVDEFGRTSAEGVWALGDVSSGRQLKHLANDQARTVRHNLLHPDALVPLRTKAIPSAVFSDPQLARVGDTLEEAIAAGTDAVAFTQRLSDTANGWALEDTTSVCTVVAERDTGRVLGAQLMAPQASSLIQPLIDAVAQGRSAREAATTQMWIHPAAMELVENALLGAAGAAATRPQG